MALYKRERSPCWYAEFVASGKRYCKALGEDLQQAESMAKAAIQASSAGTPLPVVPRPAVEGVEVVEVHRQRAVLRQSPSGT